MTNDFNNVAVIRDTQDGTSYLVPTGKQGIDTECLEAAGFEISGWLGDKGQYAAGAPLGANAPEFTECNDGLCDRVLICAPNGNAPEFCAEHDEDRRLS